MSDRAWYYVLNNAQVGPVPESELKHLFRTGALSPVTLVWSEILAQWTPANQVPALDPNSPAPQPVAQTVAQAATQTAAAVMAEPAPAQAAGTLAPSELILLNAEQFVNKANALGNGNFDLLHMAGQVSLQDLTKVMYGALFLTLEQNGAISLQMQAKKALMGLRSVQVLTAVPTGGGMAAPRGSLEEAIQAMLAQAGPLAVEDILYHLLRADSSNPWSDYVYLAVRGLNARGLVVTEEKKAFLSKSIKYHATPELIAASRQDLTWVRQLVSGCAPAQWQTLTGAITRAVGRRTESRDDGPDFD